MNRKSLRLVFLLIVSSFFTMGCPPRVPVSTTDRTPPEIYLNVVERSGPHPSLQLSSKSPNGIQWDDVRPDAVLDLGAQAQDGQGVQNALLEGSVSIYCYDSSLIEREVEKRSLKSENPQNAATGTALQERSAGLSVGVEQIAQRCSPERFSRLVGSVVAKGFNFSGQVAATPPFLFAARVPPCDNRPDVLVMTFCIECRYINSPPPSVERKKLTVRACSVEEARAKASPAVSGPLPAGNCSFAGEELGTEISNCETQYPNR